MKATQLAEHLVQETFGHGRPFTAEVEKDPSGGRQGIIHYFIFSSAYLIDICAWDNAYCLDILVFLNDKNTEAPVWSAAGACNCREKFESRYSRLIDWLEKQECKT